MADINCDYEVRCKSCFKKFTVQMFDSPDKALWLADNKDWYCDPCKQAYFDEKAAKLAKAHAELGFPELTGTPKRMTWAEQIRAELINKVNFLNQSLKHEDEDAKEISDKAFDLFFKEWHQKTDAKWWIDNKKLTVRDIAIRIKEISDTLK